VADVLDQVANGMAWESIVEEWRGAISKEAIAEAVKLASEAFISHAPEFAVA
jgi:heme oxygenase